MTIYTDAVATPAMQDNLTRTVSVLDIANHDKCKLMSVFRPSHSIVNATGGIDAVLNLSDINHNLQQTDSVFCPQFEDDEETGRETGLFNQADVSYMKLPDFKPFLNNPFSYLAVFKLSENKTQRIIGGSNSTSRCVIEYLDNRKIRFFYNGANATDTTPLELNKWYAAIASYDGSSLMRFEILGRNVFSANSAAEISDTEIFVSDPLSAFGLTGKIDMAAYFDVCLHANTALLNDVKTMLNDFYGDLLA